MREIRVVLLLSEFVVGGGVVLFVNDDDEYLGGSSLFDFDPRTSFVIAFELDSIWSSIL